MRHFMNNGKEYLRSSKYDNKYRQGRSYEQREGHYKFLEFLGAVVVVFVFGAIFYLTLKLIYGAI